MKEISHAKDLLVIAKRDLRALAAMEKDEEAFDDAIFGFHAQQTAEKCFKAWLSLLGQTYPLKHDLSVLLEQLEKCAVHIEPFEALVDLNAFAVSFRYTASFEGSYLNRGEILDTLKDLYHVVENELEER